MDSVILVGFSGWMVVDRWGVLDYYQQLILNVIVELLFYFKFYKLRFCKVYIFQVDVGKVFLI